MCGYLVCVRARVLLVVWSDKCRREERKERPAYLLGLEIVEFATGNDDCRGLDSSVVGPYRTIQRSEEVDLSGVKRTGPGQSHDVLGLRAVVPLFGSEGLLNLSYGLGGRFLEF